MADDNTVLLTDYAWPDTEIEQQIIESAGYKLIVGGTAPPSAEQITALSQRYQPRAILTCWGQVSSEAIRASQPLKIVARMGVGLDNIDVTTATQEGIWVTNVPDYCVEEVSDHAIALLLAWTRGIVDLNRQVQGGKWDPGSAKLRRLSEMTVGIIGMGRIGKRTAEKLSAWQCTILAHTPTPNKVSGLEYLSLPELMRRSDAVIVHAPLNASTHHLINEQSLGYMTRGGMLINVSRGGVVDTEAVARALQNGRLSAVGLDVLESEPEVPKALTASSNAIVTPHVAFSSDASLLELRRRACEEVVRVLAGSAPEQPCNAPALR